MKMNKDRNNFDYIENPTMEFKEVVYKETKEQQTFHDRQENYHKEEEIYDKKKVEGAKRNKISSNPFYLAVFLYYFWPLGLFWMWKYKVYNKKARIIISIVIPVFGTVRAILRYNR